MNDIGMYMLALLGGAGLGLFYFGGLWLTIRRLDDAPQPALLLIGSFFVRTAIALAGFYVLAAGDWRRVGVALLAFTLARMVIARTLRPARSWTRGAEAGAAKP